MRKNVAAQNIAGQMNSATDGSALTTGVSVFVTIDGGTQNAGGGTTTHKGNGHWNYAPTQAETNGNHIAFTFTHASGVNQTVNVYTISFDPHDTVRLGLTALPNAAAEAAGGLYTRGSGAGQINQQANGQIDVNLERLLNVAQSATDLKDFADDGYDPATNKVQGVVLVDTVTTVTGGATAAALANVQADTDNIQTRLPAALTVDGLMQADTLRVSGTLQTAGDIIGDTNDIQARLPAVLVGGRIDSSVGAMAADVVTAAAIANGAIDAATFAAGALDAAALAADAVAEIADGVWDEDATGHQTLGTFGQAIGDPVLDTNTIYKAVVTDATGATVGVDVVAVKAETASIQTDTDDIQARLPAALVGGRIDSSVGAMAANVVTAAAIATDAIGTDEFAQGAADKIWLSASRTLTAFSFTVASNLTQILGTALTETLGGYLAAAFKKFFDIAVPVFTTASVNQTGDSFARLGLPAGASVSVDIAAVKAETASIQTDTNDIQARLPVALVGGRIDADMGAISTDATAADNLETMLDGTGGQTLSLKQLNVVNSTGTAIVVQSTGGGGHGLIVTGNGAGDGINIVSGGTGNGITISGQENGVQISSLIGDCIDIQGAVSGISIIGNDLVWGVGMQITGGYGLSLNGQAGDGLYSQGTGKSINAPQGITPDDGIKLSVTGIWAAVLEGAHTSGDIMRLVLSAISGLSSKIGNVFAFRNVADTKDRIRGTTNGTGSRTSITTRDGT